MQVDLAGLGCKIEHDAFLAPVERCEIGIVRPITYGLIVRPISPSGPSILIPAHRDPPAAYRSRARQACGRPRGLFCRSVGRSFQVNCLSISAMTVSIFISLVNTPATPASRRPA